jgi:CheY-like chemotaxis protein
MILFVDDDKRRMESYVQELKFSGYQVKFKSEIDDAFNFYENNREDIQLVILDVMMPVGENFSDQSAAENGLRTGICFYRKIREKQSNLPVIILTNVNRTELLDIKNPDMAEAIILEKISLAPFVLAEKVIDILGSNEDR